MEQVPERLFRRAMEAAVRALRDLQADQVPADLRRVAKRPLPLPPPLAASLLRGLDRYDWLREKAAEAWPEADADAPGPDQASALLIRRPPGWAARLAGLAAALGGEEARREAEELERRRQAAQAEAGEWKRRARSERERARRAAREAARSLADERLKRQELEEAPAREEAARARALEERAAEVEERTAERDAARREVRRLKQRLADERRRRAAAEARAAEAGPTEWWGGTAEELAAYLDRAALMARPPAAATVDEGVSGEPVALRLPARIRPDRREAVDWLQRRSEPTTLIVDGYNAAFQLTGARDPAGGRRRLLLALRRLRRLASGPLRVVVVFDSRLGPAPEEPGPGPVEVRYAEEPGGADRAIIELAGQGGARVVVSNDREVREGAERQGAVGLWSDALVEWAQSR